MKHLEVYCDLCQDNDRIKLNNIVLAHGDNMTFRRSGDWSIIEGIHISTFKQTVICDLIKREAAGQGLIFKDMHVILIKVK